MPIITYNKTIHLWIESCNVKNKAVDFLKRNVKFLVLGFLGLITTSLLVYFLLPNNDKVEAVVEQTGNPLFRSHEANKQSFPLAAHEVDDVQYKTRFSFEHGKLVNSYGNQSIDDIPSSSCALIVYFEKKYPLIYFDKYSEKSYTLAAEFEHSLSDFALIVDSVFDVDADFQGLVLKTVNPKIDIVQTAKELSRLDQVVLVQVKIPDAT